MSISSGYVGDFTVHNHGYIPHQIPRLYHRPPGSPGDGNPIHATGTSGTSGGDFGANHLPPSVLEEDFDYGLLASRHEQMPINHDFLQAGPSTSSYIGSGSSGQHPGLSGTMTVPSDLAAMHGFPTSYSPYGHGLGANTSHYPLGLSHIHNLGVALGPVDSRPPTLYAPSPAGSESSLEESSGGSAYSSHSQSPGSLGPSPSSMAFPTNQETEEYLRRTLEIPAHLPVNLNALPEPTEKKQPPITHMIKLAIWGSKHKRLTLRQIYDEIERRYPSMKELQDKPWQRSIRHNLSLKAIFVRVERPTSDPGKGHYWAVDIRQGEGNKRDRKRRDTGRASTSRSEDDDEFSEEPEDDRSSFVVLGGRHGDRRGHQALRIPQEAQYPGGPSMYPQGSSSLLQQGSHNRVSPYPPPMIQSSTQPQLYPPLPMSMIMPTGMMPPNDTMTTMGMHGFSLPSNIEHRHLQRHNSDGMPHRSIQAPPPMPFFHPQMVLPPLDPQLAAQPELGLLSLNPSLLQSHPSSRRPAPDDEDDDSSARSSRKHRAQ